MYKRAGLYIDVFVFIIHDRLEITFVFQTVSCMCMSASPVVQYANSKYDTSQDIIFSSLRNTGERSLARLPTYSNDFLGTRPFNSHRTMSFPSVL